MTQILWYFEHWYRCWDKLDIMYKCKPLHVSVTMHILCTVLHTFPKVLIRRICLTTKGFFS